MGQIIGGAAKPKRCNLNQLSQVPTPAAGEYILVSSDNSMNAAGQGDFDCYIVGNGRDAATALPLQNIMPLGVFDLSAYTGSTYVDLATALNAMNALPTAFKKGGMSVKFVQSSDNKYVQYRLMTQTFTTTESDWQKLGAEVSVSQNTETGGVNICAGGTPLENGNVAKQSDMNLILGANINKQLDLTWINDGKAYINPSVNSLTDGQSGKHVDAFDISNYVGGTLKISLSYISANAARYCFITNAEHTTLNSIKETSENYPQDETSGLYVGTLEIPAGAKYLYMTARTSSLTANADVHLVIKGEIESVLKYTEQTLTSSEKGIARENIGAASDEDMDSIKRDMETLLGTNTTQVLVLQWVEDGKAYVLPNVNSLYEGQGAKHVDACDISEYAGGTLKIYMSLRSENASRYCFITNAEYTTLVSIKETSENYPQDETTGLYVGTLEIPSNAKYLYMTARNANAATADVTYMSEGEIDDIKESTVQYTSQTKTAEEKQIARNNIDAASKNDLDGLKGYNISDEPLSVTWINDGAVYTSASVESLTDGQNGKHTDAIDVSSYVGGSIKICLSYITESGASRFCFINGNNGGLRYAIRESLEYFTYNSETQLYEATINVPFGSKYMYLSARKNANASVYVSYRVEGLDDLVNDNLIKTTILEVGSNKSFRNIVDAIKSITNSSYLNRYEIHIFEGTYDTIEEDEIDENYVGLVIPDYVSVVGIGNASEIVLRGICPVGYETYANNISTINFMANGTLENLTVYAKNLRYCNHDDNVIFVKSHHTYNRVNFICDVTESGYNVAACCVGIGAQNNKKIDFYGCTFTNYNNTNMSHCGLLMHDVNDYINRTGIVMSLDCCKFNGGKHNIWISNNGIPALESYVILKGNIFDGTFIVTYTGEVTSNTFNFRGYANKNLTFAQDSEIDADSPDWQVVD